MHSSRTSNEIHLHLLPTDCQWFLPLKRQKNHWNSVATPLINHWMSVGFSGDIFHSDSFVSRYSNTWNSMKYYFSSGKNVTKIYHKSFIDCLYCSIKVPSHQSSCNLFLLLTERMSSSSFWQNYQASVLTVVNKSTVGRIAKEIERDKENLSNGRPSKLSPADKRCLSITSGELDNAKQATEYINSIIPNSVSAETVRRALRNSGYKAVVKAEKPLLKQAHCKCWMDFALCYGNWTVEDWKRVIWSDETKINRIGMEKNWRITLLVEEIISWYGVVLGGMVLDAYVRLKGGCG